MDYYTILSVDPTAEDIVIRAAYKALAQRYHPDRFPGSQDEAHRRMSELTKAYEVLADPVRRKKYDRRRFTYTQSVATYFNTSSRDTPLAIDPRDRRKAAAKRRRSRVALSALMIAVVVLSAFNVYQYSAQLKDWFSPGPAATTAADSPSRPLASPSGTATAGVATTGSSMPGTVAKVRNLPIAQGGATAIGSTTADAPPPAAQRPAATPAPEAPRTKDVTELPARAPVVEAPRAVVASGAAAGTAAASPRTDKRTSTKSGAATAARPDRTSTIAPVAAESEPCRDTVAALGLCSPQTTTRKK